MEYTIPEIGIRSCTGPSYLGLEGRSFCSCTMENKIYLSILFDIYIFVCHSTVM
jgi:hypothetical protein